MLMDTPKWRHIKAPSQPHYFQQSTGNKMNSLPNRASTDDAQAQNKPATSMQRMALIRATIVHTADGQFYCAAHKEHTPP